MSYDIMRKLKFDEQTGLYSIIESGFKYEFPLALHNDFKNFIFHYDLVSRWYKQLDDSKLAEVKRTSAYE